MFDKTSMQVILKQDHTRKTRFTIRSGGYKKNELHISQILGEKDPLIISHTEMRGEVS